MKKLGNLVFTCIAGLACVVAYGSGCASSDTGTERCTPYQLQGCTQPGLNLQVCQTVDAHGTCMSGSVKIGTVDDTGNTTVVADYPCANCADCNEASSYALGYCNGIDGAVVLEVCDCACANSQGGGGGAAGSAGAPSAGGAPPVGGSGGAAGTADDASVD